MKFFMAVALFCATLNANYELDTYGCSPPCIRPIGPTGPTGPRGNRGRRGRNRAMGRQGLPGPTGSTGSGVVGPNVNSLVFVPNIFQPTQDGGGAPISTLFVMPPTTGSTVSGPPYFDGLELVAAAQTYSITLNIPVDFVPSPNTLVNINFLTDDNDGVPASGNVIINLNDFYTTPGTATPTSPNNPQTSLPIPVSSAPSSPEIVYNCYSISFSYPVAAFAANGLLILQISRGFSVGDTYPGPIYITSIEFQYQTS